MPPGAHIGSSSPRQPDRRKVQATRPGSACGSKEFNPPFPFPSRESRGGRVPPHAEARCAPAQTTVTHRCTRLPPQKGCRPLAHPLRARWSTLRRRYTTGTFYLAKKRNFLLGLDSNGICLSRPHEKFLLEPSRTFLSEQPKWKGGTNRDEPTGTGSAALAEAGRVQADHTGQSGRADGSERAVGATTFAAQEKGRRPGGGAPAARPGVEPQA